jgi:Sulfatase
MSFLGTLLRGAGVAAFILFRLYGPVIAHPSDLRMHTSAPLTGFSLSLIANILIMGLVLACLASWIRRRARLSWLSLLLPGLIAFLLAKVIWLAFSRSLPQAIGIAIFVGISGVAFAFHRKWPRAQQTLSRLTDAAMLGMGVFAVVAILQLARIAAAPTTPDHFDDLSASARSASSHPRVIWILFDELSYQQTFGDRFLGLQLPNFDRLRQSSTVFTDVLPVEKFTELAIPSILLGHAVDRVHYTFGNQFMVATSSKGRFHRFNSAATPFALARANSLTTGLVGWYNPYCSMLAPYLTQCYWAGINEDEIPAQYSLQDGFWEDFLNPWEHYARDLVGKRKKKGLAQRRVHTFQELNQRADQMAQQPGLDFIFLHLPIPHPPGLYDRATGRPDESGNRSYVDNLALADKVLGQLLAHIEQSSRWSQTSVIVCGDHSWRTWLWSPMPSWIAEDQAASHGRAFDSRPLLMIHLAGQTTTRTVTAPFPLLNVHTVLDSLLRAEQPAYSQSLQK